jgi:hypothetical protein
MKCWFTGNALYRLLNVYFSFYLALFASSKNEAHKGTEMYVHTLNKPTDTAWNSSPPYKAVMFQYNPDFSRGQEAWLSPTLPFLKVICTDGRTSQMTFNGVGNGALQLLQATPSASDVLPTTSVACVQAAAACTIQNVGYQLCPDPSGSKYSLLVPVTETCASLSMGK